MTTLASLGGIRLDVHDPDPDSANHALVPGVWKAAFCEQIETVLHATSGAQVWSSLTDPHGQHGPPRTYTQWGSADGRTPLFATVRHTDPAGGPDPRPCEHALFVPADPSHSATRGPQTPTENR